MLSIKDFVFKERPAKKLVDQYMDSYIINKVVFTNAVKLWLPTLIRIYLIMNISQVVQYKKQVKEQKIEEAKSVELKNSVVATTRYKTNDSTKQQISQQKYKVGISQENSIRSLC